MELLKVFFILTIAAVAQCKLIRLSCAQIREFVDGHNSRRLLLAKGQLSGQPAASEIKSMVWDEELYAKASGHAEKNEFKHNNNSTVGSKRFETGENIFMYSTKDLNYELQTDEALKSWWNEYLMYVYSDQLTDNKVMHYTQMAWSDSVYLGCAISYTITGDWKNFLVVCNYGPTGNYAVIKPYKSGNPSRHLICGAVGCDAPYGPNCDK